MILKRPPKFKIKLTVKMVKMILTYKKERYKIKLIQHRAPKKYSRKEKTRFKNKAVKTLNLVMRSNLKGN